MGVGITVAVRRRDRAEKPISLATLGRDERRTEKLARLAKIGSLSATDWSIVVPDAAATWSIDVADGTYESSTPFAGEGSEIGLFLEYSLGVSTNRDDVAYCFGRTALTKKIELFGESFNSEIDRYERRGRPKDVDSFVNDTVKWSESLKAKLKRGKRFVFNERNIRSGLYRPFTVEVIYYDSLVVDRPGMFDEALPNATAEHENQIILVPTIGSRAKSWAAYVTRLIPNLNLSSIDAHQCFPFYVYDEDGSNRRENITDWSLDQFRTQYKDKKITKWDIFHYVYGLLHHPGYRTKFADNLKRELPRIPFAPDFRAFATAGAALAKLHLDYETLEPWKLKWIETPGVPLSYVVEKMKLSRDKTTLTVNPSLTLGDIPTEVSQYRLGNRSALEWVIDQYQISSDKRSGIVSDPNRDDDPGYVVRLIGQVVRVSVETIQIIAALPPDFAPTLTAS